VAFFWDLQGTRGTAEQTQWPHERCQGRTTLPNTIRCWPGSVPLHICSFCSAAILTSRLLSSLDQPSFSGPGAGGSLFLPPLVLKSTSAGQFLCRASVARVAASSSARVATTWSTASGSQIATARKELTALTTFRFTFPRPNVSASRTAGTGGQSERPEKGSAARRECVSLPPVTRRKKRREGRAVLDKISGELLLRPGREAPLGLATRAVIVFPVPARPFFAGNHA
jgi:hypothetical protein